jgi:hypothetical protein
VCVCARVCVCVQYNVCMVNNLRYQSIFGFTLTGSIRKYNCLMTVRGRVSLTL